MSDQVIVQRPKPLHHRPRDEMKLFLKENELTMNSLRILNIEFGCEYAVRCWKAHHHGKFSCIQMRMPYSIRVERVLSKHMHILEFLY